MVSGGCQCGEVRYSVEGEAIHQALCYCADCRKSAGAHAVGWMLFPADRVKITGAPISYNSSGDAVRQFCGRCGTSLFFLSETVFPNQIDVTIASLDDPSPYPPHVRIQLADAPDWAHHVDALPGFERYPQE